MKTNLLFKLNQLFFALLFILALTSVGNLFAQGAENKLTFDGVDDIVIVPSSSGGDLNPLDSITLECWIVLKKAPSAEHRPHFLNKKGSFALIIENNGLPKFYIHNGTSWYYTTGSTSIQVNKWYHIAGSFDGKSIKIYVNGQLEGTPTELIGSMVVSDTDFSIGNRQGEEEALNGHMDEIRAWTSTRSESEIQKSMNVRLKGDEPGLVGYWRLDNSSSSIATDSSPFENNATLTNMDTITAWNGSGLPFGNYSSYATSDDISNNIDCMVDVIFGTDDNAPGEGYSLVAIQVNDKPNRTTGLTNVPPQYWHLWSEDSLFDGIFSATVNFHYDNIFGIQDETQLELYRRQGFYSPTWEKVKGYTIETGSSTTDGKGYVSWVISQDTVGGFSGQYILSGSNPLEISKIENYIDIKLYPNPSSGSFIVELSLEEIQNIELQVLSINGKLVWSENYMNQVGNLLYPINIEDKVKGIYILNIFTETRQINKRFIIQ